MEFTTPTSYGSTVVRVGAVATDGKLLFAGTSGDVKHTETKQDTDNDWLEPTAIDYHWEGKTEDGKDAVANISTKVERWDRVDVMAEVPGFVKSIVATAAGTKPYIYQLASKPSLEVKVGDEVKKLDGTLFAEASFVS